MSSILYDFGIFGGDMRQVYIAEQLKQRGCRVIEYGLCQETKGSPHIASSLRELASSTNILLAPTPLSGNRKDISSKYKPEDLTLETLGRVLKSNHLLMAGCIPQWFIEQEKATGAGFYDFMKNQALTIFNSIATAEGAIVQAISQSTRNLHHSKCLVTGYGICGETLADKLHGLGANVTVCARKSEARAKANARKCNAIAFGRLYETLAGYDYIFNTVPAMVLGEKELEKVNPNAVIIDIASAPGGIDYEWAERFGIQAYLCPSLPGIYAPEATARALIQVVMEAVEERERIMGMEPEIRIANIRESESDVIGE